MAATSPLVMMGTTPPATALGGVPLIPALHPPTIIPSTTLPAAPAPPLLSASVALPAATAVTSMAHLSLCPLPDTLRKKILSLDFIDMAELRPEAWLFQQEDQDKSSIASLFKRRREPVTDIAIWVQCYASLIAVLAEKHPHYTPHFMAYLSTVVGCSKRCNALNWVAYDAAFRRKAAVTKSLTWGIIDQGLYAMWFSGQSKSPSCTHCLSFEHRSEACPHVPQLFPPWPIQQCPTQQYQGQQPYNTKPTMPSPSQPAQTPCGLFNANGGPRCRFSPCRFAHSCKACGAAHPFSRCPSNRTRRQTPYGMGRPLQ